MDTWASDSPNTTSDYPAASTNFQSQAMPNDSNQSADSQSQASSISGMQSTGSPSSGTTTTTDYFQISNPNIRPMGPVAATADTQSSISQDGTTLPITSPQSTSSSQTPTITIDPSSSNSQLIPNSDTDTNNQRNRGAAGCVKVNLIALSLMGVSVVPFLV